MAAPTTNGNAAKAGESLPADELSSKAPQGMVLPPRNVRGVIEKAADYVVRNGPLFEGKLLDTQGSSKMTFLQPDDEYRPYYKWRLEEIKAGRGITPSAGRKDEVSFQGREERKGPEKPEEFVFSARIPNISAQDLEIVKLTALFVARNGRSWMTQLSQREAGNYQFDFLRPQHSLYQFFSRLVDQYKELLNGGEVDGGRPQKKRIVELEANVENRFRILERARKRGEYVKWQEKQKVEAEEKNEKEKIAYAQIDWHDFVVVETVVFDERDENIQLAAPTSLNDIQSRSLEQKAAWGNDPGKRIEEAVPTFDDYENFYAQPAPAPAAQIPTTQPPQQAYVPSPPAHVPHPLPPPPGRVNSPSANQPASIKIRQNYTPAAMRAKNAPQANTSICPRCKEAIPNDEFQQHMKIEMLHPDWKDQYRVAQQRSLTTNLSTADVAANLKRLASQRADVFDDVVDGRAKRVETEAQQANGQAPVPGQTGAPPPGTRTGKDLDVQEQLRLIHEKARKS